MTQLDKNYRSWWRLLQPSWLSGLVTVIAALGVAVAIILPQLYSVSGFDEYAAYVKRHPSGVYSDYAKASQVVNTSKQAADASVFVVWAGVGLMMYYVVLGLWNIGRSVVEFVRNIEYTKHDRRSAVRQALLHVVIRLLASIGAVGLGLVFVKAVVPELFVLNYKVISEGTLVASLHVALMIIIVSLSLHLLVILARLSVLRTRVFFGAYYVAD